VDPFDLLQDEVSNNAVLRTNAASAYDLLLIIGVIGLFSTIIICGLRLVLSKNSSKKSETKATIGFKTWLAIGFFGFVSIMGIVYKAIKMLI
jgi:hypothetical protein